MEAYNVELQPCNICIAICVFWDMAQWACNVQSLGNQYMLPLKFSTYMGLIVRMTKISHLRKLYLVISIYPWLRKGLHCIQLDTPIVQV